MERGPPRSKRGSDVTKQRRMVEGKHTLTPEFEPEREDLAAVPASSASKARGPAGWPFAADPPAAPRASVAQLFGPPGRPRRGDEPPAGPRGTKRPRKNEPRSASGEKEAEPRPAFDEAAELPRAPATLAGDEEWEEEEEEEEEKKDQAAEDLGVLLVRPSTRPDPTAQPAGTPTAINPRETTENRDALDRENTSASIMARRGFNVTQNPTEPQRGDPRLDAEKNPDYVVEGEVFDHYAPTTPRWRNIRIAMMAKIKSGQTRRIALCLDGTPITAEQVIENITKTEIVGLEQLLITKGGKVIGAWPAAWSLLKESAKQVQRGPRDG